MKVFRKIVCFLLVSLILSFNVSALGDSADFTVDDEFLTYSSGGEAESIAETLKMTEAELIAYCRENGIVRLAVNKDNTKQIRAEITESPFSESIENLNDLSNSRITEIMTSITGDKSVKGEILKNGGQKFVRVHILTGDSGGEYKVMRYITVADRKEYTLTFYTAKDVAEDYTDKVFESFTSPDFKKKDEAESSYGYIILAAIILLAGLAVYVAVTIIRDIKADKE